MPYSTEHLEPYQFKKKYGWDEPCTEKVNFRVPKSMKESLKNIKGWQEILRQALAEAIEEQELSKYDNPNNKGLRTGKEKTNYKVTEDKLNESKGK